MSYDKFISDKMAGSASVGFDPGPIATHLYPFQRDVVEWACRRGRAAIFADCGLGKTAMQIEWARQVAGHSGGRVLILAPLAVAEQTVREGARFGVDITYSRDGQASGDITIANYEMLDKFDPEEFAGIVLDESSILKAFNGKTRNAIIEAFASAPYRLACTATPAPNDHMELGNHSEFLGIKTRTEMLAEYFVHDGGTTQKWRLKRHAETIFWQWVCDWAVMIKRPSDLGYDDAGYELPAMDMQEVVVEVNDDDARASGFLFAQAALTLSEQRATRRGTLAKRVSAAVELVASDPDRPWLIWCELNDEGDALESAIPGSIQVQGSDSHEAKSDRMLGFAEGRYRVLITKPSVAGFGMNWQHCAREIFVGASHSYEQTYQAIRRCWRFGQRDEVIVYVIRAETESAIVANFKRKESDAERMSDAMTASMRDLQTSTVRRVEREWNEYAPALDMVVPQWIGRDAA